VCSINEFKSTPEPQEMGSFQYWVHLALSSPFLRSKLGMPSKGHREGVDVNQNLILVLILFPQAPNLYLRDSFHQTL